MAKAGRRRSVVWECFVEHPTSGKRRVLCRFCNHDTVANPARMVRHITKYCPQADEPHKRICREYESLTVPARRRESTGTVSSAASASGSPAPSPSPSFSNSAGAVARSHASDTTTAIDHYALPPVSPAPLASSSSNNNNNAAQSMRSPDAMSHTPLLARKLSLSSARAATPNTAAASSGKSEPAANALATQMADHLAAESAREELVLALVTQSAPGDAPLWELLDNAHFRRVLAHLQPAFEPLNSRDARRVVFPRLHAAVLAQSEQFVRGASTLTVLCRSTLAPDNARVIQWSAVDQDARSELLAVSPHGTSEELAARARVFVQQLRHQLQQQSSSSSAALPIVHLCADSVGGSAGLARAVLAPSSTTSPAANDSAPTLVGGCMAQQTLLVLRDVFESLPIMDEALDACMLVAAFVRSIAALQSEMEHAAPACPSPTRLHSFIVCVREVLALQDALHRVVADSASAPLLTASDRARAFAATVRDETFWQRLAFVNDVLAPVAQLLVLSDTGRASSAQLLLCWLQLRDTVNASTLVSESVKAQLTAQLVARMRARCDDHAVACLVLDPRVHALGLSALGKRKARSIVTDLGAWLQPQPATQQHRARLIDQLIKYLTRERPFDDADSWRMMASMPRLFWLEFRAEMPELAAVALAVLSFHAHTAPLEETWRAFAQQQQRRARGRTIGDDSSSSTATESSTDADYKSDDRATNGSFNSVGPSMLEIEQVKLGFAKMAAAAGNDSSATSNSAEVAHAQSVRKFRKCFDAADLNAGGEGEDTPQLASIEDDNSSDDGDPVLALQQFRRWLQRYGAVEDADALQRDTDSSLQRFDAEWLDSSTECAQRVRACTAAFTLGGDAIESMEA